MRFIVNIVSNFKLLRIFIDKLTSLNQQNAHHCSLLMYVICVEMCDVLLPPGVNPIAVKYVYISYHIN
jgi:hypothetical protein